MGRINSWIRYAAIRGVEDLSLCFRHEHDYSRQALELPECLFETAKVLQFVSEYIRKDIILPTLSISSQLRVLRFEGVAVQRGEQVADIISKCPLLETLVLKFCKINHLLKLNISSTILTELVIDQIMCSPSDSSLDVKICAPNLTRIKISGFLPQLNFCLENLMALVEGNIGIMFMHIPSQYTRELAARKMMTLVNGMCCVRELAISTCMPGVVEAILMLPAICMFSNLMCLKLKVSLYQSDMPAIRHLLKRSPHVETLIINTEQADRRLEKDFKYEMEGTFDKLKMVAMKNFRV